MKLNDSLRSARAGLKKAEVSMCGKESGRRNAKIIAASQSTAMTAPAPSTRALAFAYVSEPRLAVIESVTYGSTVIWSSRTNTFAGTASGATASPRKRPVATPSPRPSRTLYEKLTAWGRNPSTVSLRRGDVDASSPS
jgi:hypothetical protein